MLVKSEQIQGGAIFALHIDRGLIFAGGWDKTIHIQVCVLSLDVTCIEILDKISLLTNELMSICNSYEFVY